MYRPRPFRWSVVEKLATSDRITIVVENLPDGKMRVTSNRWDVERVVFRDQVLENTGVDGRLHCKEETPAGRVGPADRALWPHGPGNAFDVITDESQTRLAEPQTRLTADE